MSTKLGEVQYDRHRATPSESRFLLTFDDGPDVNTAFILEKLVTNSVQQNVKAIFFVQTRNPEAGGSPYGHALLHREHAISTACSSSAKVFANGLGSFKPDCVTPPWSEEWTACV